MLHLLRGALELRKWLTFLIRVSYQTLMISGNHLAITDEILLQCWLLKLYFDFRERLNVQPNDTIFASSPFTFDPSFIDLFLAVSSRAKLLMVKPALKAAPLRLARILHKKNVSVMQATPSLFLQFTPEMSRQYLCGPSSQLRVRITVKMPINTFYLLKNINCRLYCLEENLFHL